MLLYWPSFNQRFDMEAYFTKKNLFTPPSPMQFGDRLTWVLVPQKKTIIKFDIRFK
jgi:hypothetical protein